MRGSQSLTGLDNYGVSPTIWSVCEIGGAHNRTTHLDIEQLQQKEDALFVYNLCYMVILSMFHNMYTCKRVVTVNYVAHQLEV